MNEQELSIQIEDELIQKLIINAKKEGIAFDDYLIKTLREAVHLNIE